MRVIAEHADDGRSEEEADDGEDNEEHGAYPDAIHIALVYPVVELCSVAEAAERLEPLSQTHYAGVDEVGNAGDDRHSGYGGIAVGSRTDVKHHRGHAGKSLARERRGASGNDFLDEGRRCTEVLQSYCDVPAMARHAQQDEEAHGLADERRHGGSRDTKTEIEDENGGNHHVEQHAAQYSVHGKAGVSLEAHLVVQREGARHERCSHEYYAEIALRIGQDGFGGTEGETDVGKEQQADYGKQQAEAEAVDQSCGRHALRLVVLLRAKTARDIVARAVTEEEAYGLDYGHHGE